MDLPIHDPREQKIGTGIYRQIEKSLRNETTFHNFFYFQNYGLTLIAESVRHLVKHGTSSWEVEFADTKQGIVNGAHTYKIILRNQEYLRERVDTIRQCVPVRIYTGLDMDQMVAVATGLNTSKPVKQFALANFQGAFDWIKALLRSKPYISEIAFTENTQGVYDIQTLLVFFELFNIVKYPVLGQDVPAGIQKGRILIGYLSDPNKYKPISTMVPQILELQERIQHEFWDIFAKSKNEAGTTLSQLGFIEQGSFALPVIRKEAKCRLYHGAFLPIVGAFRAAVKQPEQLDGQATWQLPFRNVLEIWQEVAPQLIRQTIDTYEQHGRNVQAIARDRNHWRLLFNIVYQAVEKRQNLLQDISQLLEDAV